MESTAFFEKKISLTPKELNAVKTQQMDDILLKKAKETMENKCSEQGFVLPGSIKLLSRSMGYFEAARFTGDVIYYVKLEGSIVYPADGVQIVGEVIRKNKMGLYLNYKNAIRIQVPRDLHLGNEAYDSIQIGEMVNVELKRSKFAINDPFILASGLFLSSNERKERAESEAEVEPLAETEASATESEEEELASEPESESESEEELASEPESESEAEEERA